MSPTRDFRSFFKSDPGLTHLNNAGLSPINIEAEAVVHYWVERYRREGMFCDAAYLAAVDQARLQLASFLDAEAGSIAFFQSTANALSQIAFQLRLQPGEEVIMWDQEYGSHLYPWQEACKRAGADLTLVASEAMLATPIEKLLAKVSARTRVIAISWVQFQSGAVSDLQALAAFASSRGIWTVVDTFQGLGVLPLSFRDSGLDAIVGGSHKWMTSPVGVGYLCIKQERARQLLPHNVGAYTFGTCEDPTDLSCSPKQDALRFEAGSKQVLEIIALGASAAVLQRCKVETVRTTALALAQELADGLRAMDYQITASNGPQQITPIVNFSPSAKSPLKSADAIIEALLKNKTSYARRGPGIRVAPHAHNDRKDVQFFLSLLKGR